jgi:Ca2+-binding RTX toxin-like protein
MVKQSPGAPPAPASITVPDVWYLRASPDRISSAGQAWQAYAGRARVAAEAVDAAAQRVYEAEWAGDTAETYDAHRRKLTRDVTETADLAGAVAAALDATADALRTAQRRLDQSWTTVTGRVPWTYDGANNIVFRPRTPEEIPHIDAAVREAQEIRTGLDDALLDHVVAMERTRADWRGIATTWESKAAGTSDPFTLPPEANGTYVIRDGDRVVVNTGPGNDTVSVTTDPATGEQLVTVNGVTYRYPAGAEVTIRAGEGDDEVAVAPGTRIRFTLLGGEGADTIRGGAGDDTVLGLDGRDNVHAGDGNDRVSGGADRDYLDGYRGNDLIDGGHGDDIAYGLSGDDRVYGGEGRDYLEGATGADTVDGGAGADIVSGGRDDDRLRGGAGDDAVYAGHGRDTTEGGSGRDTAYAEAGDRSADTERVVTIEVRDVGTSIRIDPDASPEFRERIEADLDMLRASPAGQRMLAEIDDIREDTAAIAADWPVLGGVAYQGNTLTITEGDANEAAYRTNWNLGEDYTVSYNPSRGESVDERPPVVGLYHELAHVYDYGNDTSAPGRYDNPDDPDRTTDDDGNVVGVENDEREAVGLPIDHDDDPSTPERIYPDHPYEYTENALRDEMGWPDRERYGW